MRRWSSTSRWRPREDPGTDAVGGDTNADDRDSEACAGEQEIGGDRLRAGLGRGQPVGGGTSLAGLGAGFTTAQSWLPVVTDAESLCVQSQQRDPASKLAFIRSLIHLVRVSPAALRRPAPIRGGTRLLLLRTRTRPAVLNALNFGSHRMPRTLGGDARGLAFLELSTHLGREQGAVHLQDLVLQPDEGLTLRLSQEGEGRSYPNG